MIKKRVFSIFASFIFLILLVSFVSAGLCKGSDGYYHDCDDFSDRYYRDNFRPSYNVEYTRESSSLSYKSEYYKENRWGYEKENTYSYEESTYEKYEKKRDYSYPKKSKTYFKDKYTNSRSDYGNKYENSDKYDYWKRYDKYDYRNKYKYEDKERDYDAYWYTGYSDEKYVKNNDYYEWDENQLTVFINKIEPIHYRRRANSEREMGEALSRIYGDYDSSLVWPYN